MNQFLQQKSPNWHPIALLIYTCASMFALLCIQGAAIAHHIMFYTEFKNLFNGAAWYEQVRFYAYHLFYLECYSWQHW